jgi:hypothetical protein
MVGGVQLELYRFLRGKIDNEEDQPSFSKVDLRLEQIKDSSI